MKLVLKTKCLSATPNPNTILNEGNKNVHYMLNVVFPLVCIILLKWKLVL